MTSRLALAFILALMLSGMAPRASAQSAPALIAPAGVHYGPPPPAYAFALRLYNQSVAAQQYAARLAAAGDAGNAAFQSDIAHRRALQAVRKFQEVVASHAYGHTPYAADSLFQEAQLEEKALNNKAAAVQAYQTLHNTFSGTASAPPLAASEQARVETELDRQNKTTFPGSILYGIMDFMVHLCGGPGFAYSYALAIFLISILVKLLMTPLSNKQYASMKEQQKLQPIIKEIQAKYKNDREAQGRKVMEVYKEHGVNPAAGCLPLLVQLPFLYLLYYMIRLYQYQFAHGQFLWIGSALAHQFPAYLGINLGQPDIPILLLYAFSMYVTQKMMISPDPQQAEQQKTMAIMTPFMTTYFFLQYHLPSAFVLYYLVFNILSTAQQQYYMKKRAADTGDTGGDGGSRPEPDAPVLPGGSGRVKVLPARDSGVSASSRRVGAGRDVPLAEAKENGTAVPLNGTNGTARGVIAPAKVHPKKKRR